MNTLISAASAADRESLDYVGDVTRAFRCPHTLSALTAYTSLRHAIDAPDDMSEGALRALHTRVMLAAEDYPTSDQRAARAADVLLLAYANYLSTVMWERGHA